MSKQILVTIPDNYNLKNVIERIKISLDNRDAISVVDANTADKNLGDALLAVAELQQKLKGLV